MNLSQQVAKHFKEVHFGGNWTCSNFKEQIADVTREEALTQVYGLNSIATLVFHISYYVSAVLKVLEGGALEASDSLSFAHPPVDTEENWERMKKDALLKAEAFTALMERLPESRLWENFTDEKYGHYYRNIHGITEHTHYHLGQIAVLKKIIRQRNSNL